MEPIAKRLKQSAERAVYMKLEVQEDEDLNERIKRLEEELQGNESDESSRPESDSDAVSGEETVVNLSAYASDRIDALPATMLPAVRPSSTLPSPMKKRKRNHATQDERAGNKAFEVLQETFPKKVPFACKPCQFLGTNMEEFEAHRASEDHRERTQTHDKTLTCALCKKTFTSQVQVEEHRAGKWHKQRVQQKKDRPIVKVCYDFLRGQCKWSDRCNFNHTETNAMRAGRPLDKTRRRLCHNFLQTRKCRFGDMCLFSHDVKDSTKTN